MADRRKIKMNIILKHCKGIGCTGGILLINLSQRLTGSMFFLTLEKKETPKNLKDKKETQKSDAEKSTKFKKNCITYSGTIKVLFQVVS